MIEDELNKYHKTPTYMNGTPFLNYNTTGLLTDYSSKGESHAKFRQSVAETYNIDRDLMLSNHVINGTVLNNAAPFLNRVNEVNMNSFLAGLPRQASSSGIRNIDSYNSLRNTTYPIYENPTGYHHSFIREKSYIPAYCYGGNRPNVAAILNTFRPTDGINYIDGDREPVEAPMFASKRHGYLAMPMHSIRRGHTIQVFHNNNTHVANEPSFEYKNFVRNVLSKISVNGFATESDARRVKQDIINSFHDVSSKTLVRDYSIFKIDDRFFILPTME